MNSQSSLPARFITFEGIDGAGKSTQIAAAVKTLSMRGIDVVQTREPGGTQLGERLRTLVLNEGMHLETEALLMFAIRREHLSQLILPKLAQGTWVISDRFTDATYAYQVGGRGLDKTKFAQLEHWVHPDFQPDLTFLFDIPPEIAAQRVAKTGLQPDRFEREQTDFFARVRAAYLERAEIQLDRFCVIDANDTPERITAQIERVMQERFLR